MSTLALGIPGESLADSRLWLLDGEQRFGLLWCPVSGFLASYTADPERWTLVGPLSLDEAIDRIRSDLPELPLTDDIAKAWRERIQQATRGATH